MSEAERTRILWSSGFVNRWHTHDDPRLRNSQDETAGHAQRVAILYMRLWPISHHKELPVHLVEGLTAALLHDAPEVASGDMAHGFKRRNPEVHEWLHTFDRNWFARMGMCAPRMDPLLKLCDHLDATMYVHRHAPEVLQRPDWVAMIAKDLELAEELGIHETVHELIFGPSRDKQRPVEPVRPYT